MHCNRAIIFHDRNCDVAFAKEIDTTFDVFFRGLLRRGIWWASQKTKNRDEQEAFHGYLHSEKDNNLSKQPVTVRYRKLYCTVAGKRDPRGSDAMAMPSPIRPIIP